MRVVVIRNPCPLSVRHLPGMGRLCVYWCDPLYPLYPMNDSDMYLTYRESLSLGTDRIGWLNAYPVQGIGRGQAELPWRSPQTTTKSGKRHRKRTHPNKE